MQNTPHLVQEAGPSKPNAVPLALNVAVVLILALLALHVAGSSVCLHVTVLALAVAASLQRPSFPVHPVQRVQSQTRMVIARIVVV